MKPPTDNNAYRYPVSIKGVVFIDGKIPLLLNERNEYELPGGKLELSENPELCLRREIKEELNINVDIVCLVDTWVYRISEKTRVFIVTYFCQSTANIRDLKHSREHKALQLFCPKEVSRLIMPDGYKKSIKTIITKTR